MHRTPKILVLAAALSLAAGAVLAQEFVFGWNPRSGDVWVDTQLADINQYGSRYRDPFIDEMTRYYGAPRELVSDLLVDRRWAPGDVYFACALAQAAGLPCRRVVDTWERDHGQGWGVVAQRLGIKPGSPEFHRLKRGFVPTYDHWGRPIRLDDTLRGEFPGRGTGPQGTAGFDPPGQRGAHGRGDGPGHAPAHGRGHGGGKPDHHGSSHGGGKGGAGHGPGKSGRGTRGGHGGGHGHGGH